MTNDNLNRWNNCKVNPGQDTTFTSVANRLMAAKSRYQTVEAKTGVPWWFIAVVHERESSQNWNASLAQGDPWNRKSTHVPRGRGPFSSWEDAAVDALVNCAPFAAHNKDWSMGGALDMLEKYNGLGYRARGIPSPYLWAGTNQYRAGKFVADGVFDPNAVDRQLGCAGLLKKMNIGVSSVPHVTAGGIGVGTAGTAMQFPQWAPYIIAGGIVLAVIAFLLIKRTQNAS